MAEPADITAMKKKRDVFRSQYSEIAKQFTEASYPFKLERLLRIKYDLVRRYEYIEKMQYPGNEKYMATYKRYHDRVMKHWEIQNALAEQVAAMAGRASEIVTEQDAPLCGYTSEDEKFGSEIQMRVSPSDVVNLEADATPEATNESSTPQNHGATLRSEIHKIIVDNDPPGGGSSPAQNKMDDSSGTEHEPIQHEARRYGIEKESFRHDDAPSSASRKQVHERLGWNKGEQQGPQHASRNGLHGRLGRDGNIREEAQHDLHASRGRVFERLGRKASWSRTRRLESVTPRRTPARER